VDGRRPADPAAGEVRGSCGLRGAGPEHAPPSMEVSGPGGPTGPSPDREPDGQGLLNRARPGRSSGLLARVDLINGHSARAQMRARDPTLGSGRSARRHRAVHRNLEERAALHLPDELDP